jgi:hypothetical protein
MNLSIERPVLEFYEDGDWLRIESPGKKTRYIQKNIAIKLLTAFGEHSFVEKPEDIYGYRNN